MPNRRTPEQPERNRIGPMGGRFFLMCADIDMLFFPGVNLLMPKARLERSSLAAHRDLSNDARRLNAGASKNAPRTVRALPARVVYPTTPVSGSGIDVDKVPASVNVVDVIQIECIRSPNITDALQTALRSALRSTSTGFLRAKNPLTCRSTSEPSLEAPPPQAPDDYLSTRFSLCSASDRQRLRRMAMARRA
jgi:hypothetical protein